jgi:cell division protein ZapA
MAQVNVTISGKTYRMACDDGQEDHLTDLANRLNRSIEQLRARFGEIGDQRLTVMAAITLADQQAEAERQLQERDAEIAGDEDARRDGSARRAAADTELAGALAAIAERIEGLASRIAGGAEGPDGAGDSDGD